MKRAKYFTWYAICPKCLTLCKFHNAGRGICDDCLTVIDHKSYSQDQVEAYISGMETNSNLEIT